MDEITDQRVILEAELRDLKQELIEEDYKIIKCMEAQLMGQTIPYDYTKIINARNAKRLRIEALEINLKSL